MPMRALCLAICLLASLCTSLLYAQRRNISIEKAPSWVTEVTFDPQASPGAGQEAGFYCLLIDEQKNISKEESYVHIAYKILTNEGVQSMSDLTFDFDPSYQKLRLHNVRIHRGDDVIDKMSSPIQTIQREQSMDRYLYDGSLTAIVNMPDVRVGDIIEYAFTVKGFNPIYEGNIGRKIYFSYAFAYEKLFERLIVPESSSLKLEYRNSDVKPEIKTSPAGKEYIWSLRRRNAFVPDNNVPDWYDGNEYVMTTTFEDWGQLASWAIRHFQISSAERQALTKRISSAFEAGNKEKFALDAIHFVQDEVRYLGFEGGLNSHKPHSPLKVFDQRFGDCKDKSLLLCSMLNSAGIEAYPVLVNTVLRDKVENDAPSLASFDHCVVQIQLDNNVYYIDPTINNQGGTLANIAFPPYGKGLVIKEGADELEQLPSNVTSEITEEQIISIPNFEGEAYLQVRTTYTGGEADNMRGQFLNSNAESIQKNYLTFYGNLFPELEVLSPVTRHDKREPNIFVVEENYRIPKFWLLSETDPDYFYAEVYPQTLENYFNVSKSSQRTTPYRLQHPVSYHHIFNIKMPENWNVQTAERFVDNEYYHYEYYVRGSGRDITVETHYRTKQDHVPLNSFEQFVSDHEEMYNNLTFQISYNKNLVGNKPGISWLGIITALVALGFGLWMALHLYYYYDPKPAVTVWDGGQPIGGWLILVGLGLLLSPFRMIFDLFDLPEVYDSQTWANLLALKRYGLFGFTLLTHVYNVLLFSYIILIIVLFIKRRSSLPRLIMIFYGANCFMTVTDSLVGAVLDPTMVDQPGYYRNVFSTIIAAAIWIPYFNTSSRVKETFVVRIADNDNDDAGYSRSLVTADSTDAQNRN